MSTKVFYTFYITKTPSQTGFGCRKSVENPVENRVERAPAPALRSRFGNTGLGVLTHRPSVCLSQRLTPARHVTCLSGLRTVRHLRSQFGNTGLVVLTHQPSVCSRGGPRSLRHVALGQGLSVSPARPGPGSQRLSSATWARVSASLQRVLGQEPAPALIGPEGLTWGV